MTRIAAAHRSTLVALALAAIAVMVGLLIAGVLTIQGADLLGAGSRQRDGGDRSPLPQAV